MRKELVNQVFRTRAVRSLAVAEPVVNAADAKGTNVNGQVTASDFKLEKTTFDPNQSGNTFMAVNFKVAGKVKSGIIIQRSYQIV